MTQRLSRRCRGTDRRVEYRTVPCNPVMSCESKCDTVCDSGGTRVALVGGWCLWPTKIEIA